MITFENEYFKSEKIDGSIIVTILEDKSNFFDVDMSGCKLITNASGFIQDEFTDKSLHNMYKYCNENKASKKELKLELRNRQLNTLMGML